MLSLLQSKTKTIFVFKTKDKILGEKEELIKKKKWNKKLWAAGSWDKWRDRDRQRLVAACTVTYIN